jgi:hypothetical protein
MSGLISVSTLLNENVLGMNITVSDHLRDVEAERISTQALEIIIGPEQEKTGNS